jgi:hypothetical protein
MSTTETISGRTLGAKDELKEDNRAGFLAYLSRATTDATSNAPEYGSASRHCRQQAAVVRLSYE